MDACGLSRGMHAVGPQGVAATEVRTVMSIVLAQSPKVLKTVSSGS